MKKTRFTLVELMVVIAIIALLMAILMPGLRKAKDQAKFVMCSTNLHHMGLAFYGYASDNNDRIPPGSCPNGVTIWVYASYGPGHLLEGGYIPLPTSRKSIIYCPADKVDRYKAGPLPPGGLLNARWFEDRYGVSGMTVDYGYEFRDSLDGNWTAHWPIINGQPSGPEDFKGALTTKIARHSLISDWFAHGYTFWQHKLKYNILMGDGSVQSINDHRYKGQEDGNIDDPKDVGMTNWVVASDYAMGYDDTGDNLLFDAIDYFLGYPMYKVPVVGNEGDAPLPPWRGGP